MVNYNVIIDVFGLCFVLAGFGINIFYLHKADITRSICFPCAAEIVRSRRCVIDSHFSTIVLNVLGMLYFSIVLVQWIASATDTAPASVDIQILMLEVILVLLSIRTVACSEKVIKALMVVRQTDNCGNDCSICEKVMNED